jgi:hypothetical protein
MQTSQHPPRPALKPLSDWLDKIHAQAQAARFAEQARSHAAFTAALANYRATRRQAPRQAQGAAQ